MDAMEDQPGLEELRLRVERLEQEVMLLRQGRGLTAGQSIPPPPPVVREARAVDGSRPAISEPVVAVAQPGNPSLESRIGSQWFSRIGILALLIATALFLKLAIDNRWIGPVGRIVAGLVAGAAVILWSERFRRQGVVAFSYALKAIGSGVLYLTLWAAFQLYGLLPALAAFGAMLLVTAWNAYMAWSQDAELLAVYALIGGFATPALLSTGGNHELFLFSYLLALDVAVVALVRLKPWPRLLVAAFVATASYYTGWYSADYVFSHAFDLTITFITLFFAVFASVNVGQRLDRDRAQFGQTSIIADVLLPLANALFTAAALYFLLDREHLHAWTPWVAVLLAAIYLGLVRISHSAVAAAVHLSLAVVFLTVAVPLKATGRGIVIGWLVEGAALLWVASRLAGEPAGPRVRSVLRRLACGALGLGFIGEVYGPFWHSGAPLETAFLNWRFATGMIGSAAFAVATWVSLRARPEEQEEVASFPSWMEVAAGSVVAFNLVTLWAVVQEIATFWRDTAGNRDASLQKDLATSGFLALYGAALLAAGFWRRRAFVRWQALILLVFTIGKTFLYDMGSLSLGYRTVSLLGLGALLMGVSFAYQKDWLGLKEPAAPPPAHPEANP